jgi:hypothetical protein
MMGAALLAVLQFTHTISTKHASPREIEKASESMMLRK